MRARDLLDRINDRPFTPFRLHLSDGSRIDLTDPGTVMVGASTVILPTAWEKDSDGYRLVKHWRTIALAHLVQFGEINETVEGKRKRRPPR